VLDEDPGELVARHAEGSARVLVLVLVHQRKTLGCAKLNHHIHLSMFEMTGDRQSGHGQHNRVNLTDVLYHDLSFQCFKS
jgi:hypothetical protein